MTTNTELCTPTFTGDDFEKISALKLWAEVVELIQSVDFRIPSIDNKSAIVSAIRIELDKIENKSNSTTPTSATNCQQTSQPDQVQLDVPVICDLSVTEGRVLSVESAARINRLTEIAGIKIRGSRLT